MTNAASFAGWGDGGVSERDGAGGCSGGQQSGLQRDLHGDGTGDGDGELDDGRDERAVGGVGQQQRHRHGLIIGAADWIGHGEHGKLHADAGVVGSPITCTAICENVGTVTATAATCSINTSGLPGHRWRLLASANVAPGGTLACTVSFTPTVAGSITVPATTSASNEVLTSNNDSSTVVPVNGPSAGADMTSTVSCVPNRRTRGPR